MSKQNRQSISNRQHLNVVVVIIKKVKKQNLRKEIGDIHTIMEGTLNIYLFAYEYYV